MRHILLRILAGATLVLALTGVATAPAHAETPAVTVSSPCYEPAYGNSWVYWTITNNTSTDIEAAITNDTASPYPPVFTVPAGGSVVRETLGGYNVDVTVAGVVVASASVSPDALRACGTTAATFNLIVDCRPSPYQVTLRIKNTTAEARQYKLVKQRGEELTGTALPGNTFITEDWVKPTDRWSLEIAGYKYVRVVNEPPLCDAPSPTPTSTPTSTPTPTPTNSSTPKPTSTPTPMPTSTLPPTAVPTSPAPSLAPASNVSGLDYGNGVLSGGLAGLLVGSALGFATAIRFRRRADRAE